MYGSYLTLVGSSQEERDSQDGDYQLSPASAALHQQQQKKRKQQELLLEEEEKRKEHEELPNKKPRPTMMSDHASTAAGGAGGLEDDDKEEEEEEEAISVVGSQSDADLGWANEFLMNSQEGNGETSMTPPLAIELDTPPSPFSIVLQPWETSPRRLKRPDSKVRFNEIVEVFGKRGRNKNCALSISQDMDGDMNAIHHRHPPSPPRKIRAGPSPLTRTDSPLLHATPSASDEEEKREKQEVSPMRKRWRVIGKKNQRTIKTAAVFHRACLKHLVPEDHCEVPERLSTIISCLEHLHTSGRECIELFDSPDKADLRWVKAVHDANYVKKMSSVVPPQDSSPEIVHVTQTTQEMLDPGAHVYADTFMSNGSWNAALYAAGAVMKAVDLVMQGSHQNAICAVRPPGHHCGRSGRTGNVKSQGFCILNNVAIGAKYALLKHDLHRIAIVDFDVHAGNGTEDIFAGDNNFLFISVHAVGENFYPETGLDEKTRDNILNLPLAHRTSGTTYRTEFEKVIERLDSFSPELLFLSSGFDGHQDDPIRGNKRREGFALTVDDYHYITTRLVQVAERHCASKVVSVLEGGYDLCPRTRGLAESFQAHIMALVGQSEQPYSTSGYREWKAKRKPSPEA